MWLGWTLWRALELDAFCERHLPRGRESVPWAQVASILVIARLCEPSSELHIAEDWYRRTALEDLLGIAAEKIHHRRLYQGLDHLLAHKRELEVQIKERLGGLFALDYDHVQLYQAEAAFRIHKSDLSIRPIWHQRAERVEAHILVCFLAFCMWKALEGWQERAGLGNSPRTILEEFGRIQCVDVVLPVADGPELRLRCVVEPDQAQAALLDRLGLRMPKRLRVPESLECSGNFG